MKTTKYTPKIIVLEGLGASGKTTVGERLCQSNSNMRFIPDIVSLNPQPAELKRRALRGDTVACKKIDRWFLACDKERELQALHLRGKGITVVMERNHVSTLGYSFAREKRFGVKAFSDLMSRCEAEKNSFVVPDAYVLLVVRPVTSIRRQVERKITAYPWNDLEFLLYFNEFIKTFINVHETAAQLVNINTENTNLDRTIRSLRKCFHWRG